MYCNYQRKAEVRVDDVYVDSVNVLCTRPKEHDDEHGRWIVWPAQHRLPTWERTQKREERVMNPGHALGCPEPSLEDLIEQACDPTFMAALERTILRDLFGE